MEHDKEESRKNSREQTRQNEGPEERKTDTKGKSHENDKRGRILQCLGNLNALHKVQGALLGQMEREIS